MTLRFLLPFVLTLAACSATTHPKVIQKTIPPVVVTPTPPIVTPPAVAAAGDDTAALQALLDKGGVVQLDARTYHTSWMLNIAVSGTVLQGKGVATVIDYQPPPETEVKDCATDRALSTNCGFSTDFPLQVWANIQKGDTSFVAAHADDAAKLSPGDWVYIAAWDPGISDAIAKTAYATVADWAQVSSVVGTTINVTAPFRTTFVTSLPFISEAGGAAGGGISFQKIILLQGIVIQDLTVTVEPNGAGTGANTNAGVAGIVVIGTLGTIVRNVTVNALGGRAMYSESSKGEQLISDTLNGEHLNEFAETVDLVISGCNLSVSDAPAIGLDLGTAYFSIENNNIEQSAGAGIYALYNVHDGTMTGNTIALVKNTATRSLGILLYGSPNISITNNTLAGGQGTGNTGIVAEGDANAKLPETSTGDVQSGNTITGFDTTTSGL